MPKLFLLRLARPTLRTWAEVVKENFQDIRPAPKIMSYSTVCKEFRVFCWQSFALKPERWSYERRKKKSHVYKFDRNFHFRTSSRCFRKSCLLTLSNILCKNDTATLWATFLLKYNQTLKCWPILIEICPYHPPSTPVTPEDSLDLTIEEAVWEADHEALQDTNVFLDHYKPPIYTTSQ